MFMFNPIEYGWMPRCVFKSLTGLSCPGCGLLRAVHALLHGRVAEAVAYNYWLVLTAPYVGLLLLQQALPEGRLKTTAQRLLLHRCVVAFYAASFWGWFVLRNVWGC